MVVVAPMDEIVVAAVAGPPWVEDFVAAGVLVYVQTGMVFDHRLMFAAVLEV